MHKKQRQPTKPIDYFDGIDKDILVEPSNDPIDINEAIIGHQEPKRDVKKRVFENHLLSSALKNEDTEILNNIHMIISNQNATGELFERKRMFIILEIKEVASLMKASFAAPSLASGLISACDNENIETRIRVFDHVYEKMTAAQDKQLATFRGFLNEKRAEFESQE
ncbi:UTP25 [Acrasis kona]|uniref:UTP25 n=1 Tax=Acrasis kona TaxID=1008807 RepID=A0AAW2Z5K2_9EUKA